MVLFSFLLSSFSFKKSSFIRKADPGSLRNQGQAFTKEPDNVIGPEDLDSMATDVTKLPSSFAMRYAADAGGSQFGQPFDKKTVLEDVEEGPLPSRTPRLNVFESSTAIEGEEGPIPFNSWFSETEATMPKEKNTKGPLDFTASLKGTDSENIDSAIELPEATQGGTVLGLEGWYTAASLHFSYDDTDPDYPDDDYDEDNE